MEKLAYTVSEAAAALGVRQKNALHLFLVQSIFCFLYLTDIALKGDTSAKVSPLRIPPQRPEGLGIAAAIPSPPSAGAPHGGKPVSPVGPLPASGGA